MSDDITIPPEVLEAAAKARYEKWAEQTRADEQFDGYAIELLCPPWSDINEDYRAELMEQERAAVLAMLRAWETDTHRMIVGTALDEVGGTYPAIILPLTENANDKA